MASLAIAGAITSVHYLSSEVGNMSSGDYIADSSVLTSSTVAGWTADSSGPNCCQTVNAWRDESRTACEMSQRMRMTLSRKKMAKSVN